MSDPDGNSSNGSTDSSGDSLNGSWVKLDASYRNGSSGHPISAHNGKMEDLLAEAVAEESRSATGLQSNRENLRPSTRSNEVLATTETMDSETKVLPPEYSSSDPSRIEDWSSRVEPHPPKKWRLTYPPRKDSTSCIDKIQSEKSADKNMIKLNFYIVIPTLLITHVIAFGIGVYLGRRTSSGPTSV